MSAGIAFVSVGSARVAYQVHGDGDLDIVYSPGLASHLDLTLEQPRYRRYIDMLRRYGRVVRFDRRGVGVSDPVPVEAGESWELWVDDLAAVLDHAGSGAAAILAANDAGPAAILFAATRPDLVRALVLFNTTARFGVAPDYPVGHPPEVVELVVDAIRTTWGTEDSVALLVPSLVGDEPFRQWYARFQRGACSPAAMAESLSRLLRMDCRHVLPEVRCPTLVLHRSDYTAISVEHGRYLADSIPGATFVELDGGDAPIYTQGTDDIVERIGTFLGRAPKAPPDDRSFKTVLFTDIVASTERAVELGDHEWHRLLDDHDTVTRDVVGAHGGVIIKTTGDGALASFAAPSAALAAATGIRSALAALGITIRAGLHAGPVVTRFDGDISGVAVNIAARVLAAAAPSEIVVSAAVVDLAPSAEVTFEDRGVHRLKGLPDQHHLYAVTSG